MTVIISAVILALAAQIAQAEQRVNKPFNTTNGRTSTAAPAAPRAVMVSPAGSGATANSPTTATNAMLGGYSSGGNRGFVGGGRQAVSRAATGQATRRSGKTFWSGVGRKADGDSTPSTEELPPHFTKPGALIRTTGQLPIYEKAETRTHTVDAGEIVLNNRKAVNIGRAPSVQHGPKDTLPPPNPGTFTGTTTGGAAANTGSGSTGGGHNNNGSGNNGKDKPGDDDDGHGGDRAKDKSFSDAF